MGRSIQESSDKSIIRPQMRIEDFKFRREGMGKEVLEWEGASASRPS